MSSRTLSYTMTNGICMMLWRYYCKCCATITSFIMDTLRSIWSIEFATIIRDATTELHDDFDVDMFFAYILIYGSIIFGLVWIAVFIAGLRSTKTKDATENTNKDPIKNTNKDPTKIKYQRGSNRKYQGFDRKHGRG